MTGGQKDNAITREAVCRTPDRQRPDMMQSKLMQPKYRKVFVKNTKEAIRVSPSRSQKQAMESAIVLHPTSREKVLFYLMEVPFGIQKMSANIEGLVETSTNIGIVSLSEDEFFASSGVRSSVEAARDALSDKIQYLTEFLGGEYEIQGAYPAWEYRKESPLRDKMVKYMKQCTVRNQKL